MLTNRFQAIVRSMSNTLVRSARSGVLNTARDFSCCVLTADDELLVMAESLPIHVMSGPDIMARTMKELHPDFRPGDAFLHNSPYHGNSHAADWVVLVPVFDENERHRFTVLVKAHQADCGNALPTTYMAAAVDVYAEGALIFPAVRVQCDYRDVKDVIRMCRMRIRVPDQWWGDYSAMIGAARIGERRLVELQREVGCDILSSYTAEWFDYSEHQMKAAITQLPAGEAFAEEAHDPFPGVPHGIHVKARVRVRPGPGRVEVDLTDNPDCQPCGLNLTEATARTAAMIGVFNSIGHVVPPNAGSFRCLDIKLRENCCVGIPRHPTSCSVATTNLADRVTSCVQRAIAEFGDGFGMAGAGMCQPPAWGVISGRDPRAGGAPFVNQIFLAGVTGGPATPRVDGWLTLGHAGNAGMMLRDSVEIDEIHHPIRVLSQRLLPDTEGAGRTCGAPGAYVEYGPVNCEIQVVYQSDGNVGPALGVRGGLAGAASQQAKRDTAGILHPVGPCGPLTLGPGETVISIAGGGGGYGLPTQRDPQLVRKDVLEGLITAERARETYGLILDPMGLIDWETTSALRAEMERGLDGGRDLA